jgi:hypothetical protein
MQTSTDTVTSAGIQTPVLTADQLQPGVFITGVAMAHVWEIMRHLPLGTGTVWLRKVGGAEPCAADSHQWVTYGRGQVCDRCAIRSQAVADLLPLRPEKARVYTIQPAQTGCQAPHPYTVYAGVMGSEVRLYQLLPSGLWNVAMPLFSELVPVWTVPDALRALVPAGCMAASDPGPAAVPDPF